MSYPDVPSPFQGYHGDTSKTFLCGEVDEANKRLVKVSTLFSGALVMLALAIYYFLVMNSSSSFHTL